MLRIKLQVSQISRAASVIANKTTNFPFCWRWRALPSVGHEICGVLCFDDHAAAWRSRLRRLVTQFVDIVWRYLNWRYLFEFGDMVWATRCPKAWNKSNSLPWNRTYVPTVKCTQRTKPSQSYPCFCSGKLASSHFIPSSCLPNLSLYVFSRYDFNLEMWTSPFPYLES